ncbi:hypothetical protein [Phaffia rhodozyma]|uniref:Uncharacterized protein n=1 Tax=Phaffia rhodozyma TaxID=264483 RepID=A0A0F7SQE9_PHARH|nr:hypothetical protein [Phaffia rhodozyma]
MSSASFTPSTPSTPHPRLISKMAVVACYTEGGRSIGHDAHDGVVVSLFCKVNIRKGGYARHLLFPDENITLLSTSAHPLESPQNALLLNPPPPLPIQEAAQYLNIPTTIQSSPSSSTSSRTLSRSQKVKIVIQDFSVCLISEGGKSKGDLPRSAGRPIESGANEETSKAWLIMLEFLIPLKSRPPLNRYAISIPLPRCLSNTLSFRLQGSSSSEEEANTAHSFLTTPRLLPGPSSSRSNIDRLDRILEGTFQSTTSLEIRWAPQQMTFNESSGNISIGAGAVRPVALRNTQQRTIYHVMGEERKDELIKVKVEWELTSTVHYSGVENTGHLDFSVDAPSDFIWDDLPLLQANRGLSSSSTLVPQPLDESHFTETGPQLEDSLVISPSPLHSSPTSSLNKLRVPISSVSKNSLSRKGSGESSSHPSLLRQQPPSSVDLGDRVDASFSAFDTSLRPSPSSSPIVKHQSPLGNSPSLHPSAPAELPSGHQAKVFRLNLDISQIHVSREPFVVNVSGTVLLKPSTTGEVALPEFAIEVDWLGSEADLRAREWLIQAPKQVKVYPPSIVERLPDQREGKAWGVSSLVDLETSYSFVVGLPVSTSEADLSTVSATMSPARAIRRKSSLFVRQPSPPLEIYASTSLAAQLSSSESLVPFTGSRSILSVYMDTFLSIDSAQKGEPKLWNQLSRMKVSLSPSNPSTSLHEEDAFFEFGIIAGPSVSSVTSTPALNTVPFVQIVSIHVDGVSLPFTLQKDPALDPGSDIVAGALGYIRVGLDDETREVGGQLEVLYTVSGLRSSIDGLRSQKKGSPLNWDRRSNKATAGEGFQLGLPSFENEVKWEEITVHVIDGYFLSIDAKSSSPSFVNTTSKSVVRSVTHSLPALATPHLSVMPLTSPPLASKSNPTPASLSWSRLPFLLLTFWLLFSIGSEIRALRSGMIEMAVEMRGKNEMIQRALERCETGYQRPISAWQAPFVPPSTSPLPLSSPERLSAVSVTRAVSSFATSGSASASASASPSSLSDTTSATPFDISSSIAYRSRSPSTTQDYIHTRSSAEHSPLRPNFVHVPIFQPPLPSSTHGSGSLSPTSSYSFTTLDQFLSYTKQLINQDAFSRRLTALRQLVGYG